MKLLGFNDSAIDITNPDNLGQKFFEFCPVSDDYFLNFHFNWDVVTSTVYVFTSGRFTFQIPSGFYIFIGCPTGLNDWILIDEIIDRDIEVFVMPTSLGSWSLQEFQLKDIMTIEYVYPSTKNPVPMLDETGKVCVIASPVDQYHKFKNKDDNCLFVM